MFRLPTRNRIGTLSDFQPVPVEAPAAERWQIAFQPEASLYATGNDPVLLLRELARLGTAQVHLDDTGLPALDELDPECAYLRWNVELTTDQPEAAIREVFEFAEGTCTLDVSRASAPALPAAHPEPACESP